MVLGSSGKKGSTMWKESKTFFNNNHFPRLLVKFAQHPSRRKEQSNEKHFFIFWRPGQYQFPTLIYSCISYVIEKNEEEKGEVSFIFCELATVGGILPRSTHPKQGNMRSEREEGGIWDHLSLNYCVDLVTFSTQSYNLQSTQSSGL